MDAMEALNIAVLTVSDTRTEETDRSGQALVQRLTEAGHRLADKRIVPDDVYQIRAVVAQWIADPGVQVVLTTGGTGFTGRDSTPEAVSVLLDKRIEGFGERFRQLSGDEIGSSTIQSRALGGFANATVVFCLPGSTGACRTGWDGILAEQLDSRHKPCNFANLVIPGRGSMAEQRAGYQSPPLQPISAALDALLAGLVPLPAEQVPLEEAAGRVLAEPVMATLDVPPFDNSAMDGYALRASDAGKRLPVSQRIAAGSLAQPLAEGSCARIFTGGQIPAGADCVVMQERVTLDDGHAEIPHDVPAGDNVRLKGRDVQRGDVLLKAGQRTGSGCTGAPAGQGVTEVSVRRRPRVALLSTGDEIVDPGMPLQPGQLYNSNRPMLTRLLERFGAEVVQRVSVPDDYARTVEILEQAAAVADVVVSTGGVSVGEEDHVKAALESLGQLDMWKLAIRPGKPLALGRLPTEAGARRALLACRAIRCRGSSAPGSFYAR